MIFWYESSAYFSLSWTKLWLPNRGEKESFFFFSFGFVCRVNVWLRLTLFIMHNRNQDHTKNLSTAAALCNNRCLWLHQSIGNAMPIHVIQFLYLQIHSESFSHQNSWNFFLKNVLFFFNPPPPSSARDTMCALRKSDENISFEKASIYFQDDIHQSQHKQGMNSYGPAFNIFMYSY